MNHHDKITTTSEATSTTGKSVIVFTWGIHEHQRDEFTIRTIVAKTHTNKLMPNSDVTFDTVGNQVFAWMTPAVEVPRDSTFYITDSAVFWRYTPLDSHWNARFLKDHATMKDIPAGISNINIINPEVFTACDDIGNLPTITEGDDGDIIVSTKTSTATGTDILPLRQVIPMQVPEEMETQSGCMHYDDNNKAPETEPLLDARESSYDISIGNQLDNIFIGTLTTEQGIDLIVAAASRDIELALYLKHRLNTVFSVL